MSMKDIICFSANTWYPIPTRKQHVMKRITGEARVFYFEPPVTWIAGFKDPAAKKEMKKWKQEPVQIAANLTAFAIPPFFPFYNIHRWINTINQNFLARYVRKMMKKYGIQNPILWIYVPAMGDLVDKVPHSAVIYDITDKHSEYKGFIRRETVEAMEKDLASKADVVFTTAKGLYDIQKQVNPHTYLIPNGSDFALFNQAAQKLPVPEDMKDIQGPVLGYVGVLQEWVDYDIIEYIASQKPESSIVLVGPQGAGVQLDHLKKYKNIHFLGRKKQEELPQYISQFDVCLNIFRGSRLSKDVSPLKFYEYLATGKPVVSTRYPEQVEDFQDAVYIADSKEEFLQKCELALREPDSSLTEKRLKYGHETSWDARVAQIVGVLKEKHIL